MLILIIGATILFISGIYLMYLQLFVEIFQ